MNDEIRKLDYLVILEEILSTARQNGLEAAAERADFDQGRAFAYYDILTVAIEQAELLGIPLEDLGLQGFDADRELLHVHRRHAA